MVIDKSATRYFCTICGEGYDCEEDAEDCYQDCFSDDINVDIEEKEINCYQCEMCGKESEDFDIIKACEDNHIEKQDKWYALYEMNKNMQKLIEIGNHPMQKKIFAYCHGDDS